MFSAYVISMLVFLLGNEMGKRTSENILYVTYGKGRLWRHSL